MEIIVVEHGSRFKEIEDKHSIEEHDTKKDQCYYCKYYHYEINKVICPRCTKYHYVYLDTKDPIIKRIFIDRYHNKVDAYKKVININKDSIIDGIQYFTDICPVISMKNAEICFIDGQVNRYIMGVDTEENTQVPLYIAFNKLKNELKKDDIIEDVQFIYNQDALDVYVKYITEVASNTSYMQRYLYGKYNTNSAINGGKKDE